MRRTLVLVAAALLAGSGVGPSAAASGSPWDLLAAARERLSRGPATAEFRQTFVPAGFDSGDSESGRLTIDLPECLRWDYFEPFPKSFLLCGHVAHTWNEGETTGRRIFVSPGEDPGLDLVRLDVAELKRRYSARLLPAAGDRPTVELSLRAPEPGSAAEIRQAVLTFAPDGDLESFGYTDSDGNSTRFELGELRREVAAAAFEPPAALEWLTD